MYNRKRQRRQAAAIVVESLWNNNSNSNDTSDNKTSTTPTRKSTAQPRPVVNIPPRGIGPIADPNVNDVLCGRGGRINSHTGNIQFRDIIHSKKKDYLAPKTKKLEKAHIAAGIVNGIRTMDPSGRFLKEEKGTGMWYDIGDAKAIKKTGQALREDAPDIRPAIDVDIGGSSGDEKKTGMIKTAEKTGMQQPIVPQQQWNNNNNNINNSNKNAQQQDYHMQMQMSMPPPFLPQGNNNNNTYASQEASQQQQYMQHQPLQNQQGFETRNIPIQVPLDANQPSFPNHAYSGAVYSGVQSATNKLGSASKKAMEALSQVGPRNIPIQMPLPGSASRKVMEALSQTGPTVQQQYSPYGGQPKMHSDDLSFGIAFHEPNRMINDDNTISTISGFSGAVSSLKSGRASDLMNMSLKSNFSLTNSARLSGSLMGGSNQNRAYDRLNGSMRSLNGSMRSLNGSIRSGSMKGFDPMMLAGLGGSIKSGFGGSIARSSSFPDLNADNWKFEGVDNHLREETCDRSLGGTRRTSSAMSIGSIMDLQSNASSSQWFQAAMGNLPMPDDKSTMSSAMMSTDLDALDLPSTFHC